MISPFINIAVYVRDYLSISNDIIFNGMSWCHYQNLHLTTSRCQMLKRYIINIAIDLSMLPLICIYPYLMCIVAYPDRCATIVCPANEAGVIVYMTFQ